jgi:hypothetical protein
MVNKEKNQINEYQTHSQEKKETMETANANGTT